MGTLFLWSEVIKTEGIIMTGDFSFPIEGENFEKYYYPMWNDLRSQTNFERIPRIVIMAPFLALNEAGIEVGGILKVFLVSTYAVMTFSMFFFLDSIQRQYFSSSKRGSWIVSLIGAFVFAYNPVSMQFAGGISILFSLAMLPLILSLIISRSNDRFLPFYITGLLLLSLGHPFTLVMNAFIATVFFAIVNWRKISMKFLVRQVGLVVISFTLLFSWYWLPYFGSTVSYAELGRENNVSKSLIDTISDNSPLKILLLERDKFLYVNTEPTDPYLSGFHYGSLFVVVALAIFIPLLFLKTSSVRITILLLVGLFASVILTLGTTGPFGGAYYSLVSENPNGWIFRSPLKFQLYESFFASALFGLSVAILHQKFGKLAIISLAGSVIVLGSTFYGIYDASNNSLRPIDIPKEYFEINQILAKDSQGYKVVYYPLYSGPTLWSRGLDIQSFDSRSSSLPAYEIASNVNIVNNMLGIPYSKATFDNYPVVTYKTQAFRDYLSSLGVKYIVFHDDRGSALDKANLSFLLNSKETKLIYNSESWYLFELLSTDMPAIRTSTDLGLSSIASEIPRMAKPDLSVLSAPPIAELPTTIDPSLIKLDLRDDRLVFTPSSGASPRYIAFDLQHNYNNNWRKLVVQPEIEITLEEAPNESDVLVITNSGSRGVWLTSDEFKVNADETIIFSFNMEAENAQGIHVKLVGYYEDEGRWRDLDSVVRGLKGDLDWRGYWWHLSVPQNVTAIKYFVSSGTVLDQSEISRIALSDLFVDKLQIVKTSEIVTQKRISPTEWLFTIDSSTPYLLVFPETFDSGWQATIEGVQVDSTLVNGMINGFYVDRTGTHEVRVLYKPQVLFDIGASVSALTLGVIITYFVFGRKLISPLFRRLNYVMIQRFIKE